MRMLGPDKVGAGTYGHPVVQILPRYVCVNAVHGDTEHFHDIAT